MELLFWILFVCYTSYACNRKCVTFSLPSLIAEGLDKSHAGLIVSSQNIAFSGSKFLAGILSDRLDPVVLFLSGLFAGGCSALAFAGASSTGLFCALWFLNGLAQGCGWPAIAKILRQRAPPSKFGTLWSLMASSINVAGSASPVVAAMLIVRFGWRCNVFVMGFFSVSLGVIFLFVLLFSSKSVESGINETKKPSSLSADSDKNIRDLFFDPYMWLLSSCFLVIFSARTAAVDWGQLYLMEERGHSQFTASAFTSSFETGGFVGRIMAGYLTDWVIRRNVREKVGPGRSLRLPVAVLFLFGSLAALHCFRFAVSEVSSSMWIVGVGAAMGMSFYGVIAVVGLVAAESAPPHLSGSSNAVVSLFGNIGAVLSGLPFSFIAKYHGWSTVFLLVELMVVGICILLCFCRNMTPGLSKHGKIH